MAPHVALLGDSIFDNRAYTRGDPDVIGHLRRLLPPSWKTTLLALDGTTTGDVDEQVRRVPADASHLVLAVGGNDALMNSDLLRSPVASTAEALRLFADRAGAFEAAYRRAAAALLALGREVALCTIYNGNLEPREAPLARVALAIFNDAIVRVAVEARVNLIELRLVCTEPADYANPIEPSGQGGRKIAQAIADAVGAHDGRGRRTVAIGGAGAG
ncbi:MAG TPA: SGNH/GDSL hydrolase family protein [Vicinamibacterales bacterium]|nr:SGNH/GDSL hydrolase family protein [Vicinamibacterales bacterium]